jgi:protocatechuate 3,4-dioxygenase beta subunit
LATSAFRMAALFAHTYNICCLATGNLSLSVDLMFPVSSVILMMKYSHLTRTFGPTWLVLVVVIVTIMNLSFSYGQQCTPTTKETPQDLLGLYYLENSEMKNRLASDDFLSNPNRRFFVYGKVINSTTCLGVPNVKIEVWYAGPMDNEGDYYQRDQHRGYVITNDSGEYNVTQLFPALYPTRPTLHNHFRLTTSSGKELLVTQLYFYGDGPGYIKDRTERTLQAVEPLFDDNFARWAEFNMYIDGNGAPRSFFQRIIDRIFKFVSLFVNV